MERTPRSTAGNKYQEVLQALKGGHDLSRNYQSMTFSSRPHSRDRSQHDHKKVPLSRVTLK